LDSPWLLRWGGAIGTIGGKWGDVRLDLPGGQRQRLFIALALVNDRALAGITAIAAFRRE